ncbi:glycosyltransferase family 4 protein [Demetria terragena]|uniref:glycosyltransferase family 4 protein n=1 Tax=Demetria terragena TaxID=63959 RepID=UPI00035D7D76|nr:glycosyltransferase family 4 protein [Demetria terragena]
MPQHRVALVSSSYHPRIGGVEQHVRQAAAALQDLGHHVEVWTVAMPGDLAECEVDGVRVRYLPCPLPRQSFSGVADFVHLLPGALRAWRQAWKDLRPGIVHVHCFGPSGPWALAAAAVGKRPVVLTSHGETFADREVFDGSWLLRTALQEGVRRARAVTGCSAAVLADLRSSYGLDGGAVVQGGVAPCTDARSSQVPGLPRGTRYVVGVGRLVPVKGFDVLADAAKYLPDDCWVVLAGDGPDRARLAGHDRVLTLGVVPPDEVAGLMAGAVAVAVPSRREAFGLVVLEAWAAESPVVASAVDGLSDLIDDDVDGLLVPGGDPQALAAALRTLLETRSLGERLVSVGRSRVREFTWEATAAAYARIYQRVTSDSTRDVPARSGRGKTPTIC